MKVKGNQELKSGNYDKAIFYYDEAIEMDPTNAVYYNNKALTYLKWNKPEKALMAANDAIRLRPSWFKGYSSKGTALFNIGDISGAISAYKNGLKRDPSNESLKQRLAEAQKNFSGNSASTSTTANNPSSTSTSVGSGNLTGFLWSGIGAKKRTLLGGLRIFAIMNGFCCILPLFVSLNRAFSRLIVTAIVIRLITIFDTFRMTGIQRNMQFVQKLMVRLIVLKCYHNKLF